MSTRQDNPEAGYDVVVVGGGAAGCVVAARLSEDGTRRVLLLEAGPDLRALIPADVRDGWQPTTGHDWGYVAEPDAAGVARPLPRGKLLGGCSSTNATFALRGHPADYDAWARAGNDGWSFDEVLPFFTGLENDADFGEAAWHGDGGPLPIRRYHDDEFTDVAQAGLKTLEQAGCTRVPDANAPGAVGVAALPVNTLHGERISTALAYLPSGRSRVARSGPPGSSCARVRTAPRRCCCGRASAPPGTFVNLAFPSWRTCPASAPTWPTTPPCPSTSDTPATSARHRCSR